MRLFAALDPDQETGEEMLRWARGALRQAGERDARVLDAEALHVTLLFLGERPPAEMDELADALADVATWHGPLELRTGAPVWLPPRRPRALAVEIHDSGGGLTALQRDLAVALCAVSGLAVPRRFRAHLTVARARSFASHAALPATPALGFVSAEVALYRSHLEPRAARYERVACSLLAG